MHPVMMVDFETIYCSFGHPSKEALKLARKHTRKFPEINISSDDPTCLGCTQGKMSNQYFLISTHCAFYAF